MSIRSGVKFGGTFLVDCYSRDGARKWSAEAPNMVVDEGLKHILDLAFTGGTAQISPWYIGLLASTTVLSSYQSSNLGKATEYSQANLVTWVEARSSQTLTNAANLATFSIDKDATTIEGAYLKSSNSKSAFGGHVFDRQGCDDYRRGLSEVQQFEKRVWRYHHVRRHVQRWC